MPLAEPLGLADSAPAYGAWIIIGGGRRGIVLCFYHGLLPADARARRVLFFTVNLQDRRQSILTEQIDLLREVVAGIQETFPFHIDAAVILPEHLHMIWTLPVDDDDYSRRWSRIKSEFSRRLPAVEGVSASRIRKRERGIWQRRFWEHTIQDDVDYERHVDYIHYNPVKHGHVKRPIDWPYSSLHRYVGQGILQPTWGVGSPPPDMDWD